MRQKRRLLLCSLFLLAAVLMMYTSCSKHQSNNIDSLYRQFSKEYVAANPETSTILGNLSQYGIRSQDEKLQDRSDKAMLEKYTSAHKYLKKLASFDKAVLSQRQKLSAEILRWHLEDEIRMEKFAYNPYVINSMTGVQIQIPDLLINIHPVTSKRDAENYVQRLSEIQGAFKEVIAASKVREEKGIIPPSSIIKNTMDQCTSFISASPEKNAVYTSFVERLEGVKEVSQDDKRKLSEEALRVMKYDVYGAYKNMIAYLEKLKPKAVVKAGVWELPEGDRYYEALLKHYTTVDITPEEVHTLGKKEVERISAEIKEVSGRMGIDTSLSPRLPYESITGKDKIYAVYEQVIRDMEKKLPEMFDLLPESRVVQVQAIPAFRESSASSSYVLSALDGSRPGIFFVKTNTMQYKETMARLAYHETIPGHHLQRQIVNEAADIPLFQKVITLSGYTEGWATYGEKLAGELGAYNKPADKLAYLLYELAIARNLVLDTGIHYKRWSREEAIEYCTKVSGISDYNNAVDRSIAMPGQYCSYKVGQVILSQLREDARLELGDRFDLKKFHNIVLKNGAMPLDILKREVKDSLGSAIRDNER